jgi:acid phosphatase
MKRVMLALLFPAIFLVAAGSGNGRTQPPIPWPPGLPVYDHVVIIVEENRDFEQIIGNTKASPKYINQTLRKEGANFTQMFGEEHNSQGNYFWLFSGSNHDVGFEDEVPKVKFDKPNLGAGLIAKKKSFKAFCEDLPEIGSDVVEKGNYVRKHAPWFSFSNVPAECGVPFSQFPTDAKGFEILPTVSFVIPNLDNDMHNGTILDGDAWLQANLDKYYQWAKQNNSLLIVTWDENVNPPKKDKLHFLGLTNPFTTAAGDSGRIQRNQIATIFAGARIIPGDYAEHKGITHVNILRTLEAMYGLPRAGAQQKFAAAGGIRDEFIIMDVFVKE